MKYAKKKKVALLPWLGLAVAVVILAVVLVAVLSGGDDASDPTLPSDNLLPGETQQSESAGETDDASAPTDTTDSTDGNDPTEAPTEAPTDPSAEATEATDATSATEKATEPTTGGNKEDVQDPNIKTPYCTLHYPEEWKNFLRVEISEGKTYDVAFYSDLDSGKSQKLFTIRFGGSEEDAYAMLKMSGGKSVPVQVEIVTFKPDNTWSEQEINIVFTMQEALNDVLSGMSLEIPEQPSQGNDPTLPSEDGESMAIDTPFGVLYYPSRWLDYLSLEINDTDGYSVAFFCKIQGHKDQHLFTIHFGGSKGVAVGTTTNVSGKTVEVRLEIIELDLDATWSDGDKSIVFAMQEDLNYLLTKLNE